MFQIVNSLQALTVYIEKIANWKLWMRMTTRKDKIIALLPPPDSDGGTSDDDAENFEGYGDRYSSDTSEAPSIPDSVAEELDSILRYSDTDTEDVLKGDDNNCEAFVFKTPVKNIPPFTYTPTPKSIFTPLNNSSDSSKEHNKENTEP
nr:uncharacterized protein LOC111503519 [Leptinotarsa decemlineata]